MRSKRVLVVAVVIALSALAMACTSDDAGPVPTDPVLAKGQQVYKAHCQTCHGAKGQGGSGKKLAGDQLEADFPDIADQIAVINDGKSSMPGWKNSLTAEEIEAVARYERECLGTTCP